MTQEQEESQTLRALSVVRGEPTADELAALLVVLASRQPARGASPGQRASLWSSRSRALRTPLFPAPGAWRASGLPR